MAKFEDLTKGVRVKGVATGQIITVIDVKWHSDEAIEVIFILPNGKPDSKILYRDDELNLEIIASSQIWSFDMNAELLKLVSEAYRIRMGYSFDPFLAVHISQIDPLPHQITAVYESMLPRQPLRFLLADDPGAGKTIMAGLLIRELQLRGDVKRCLICAPGSLVEQWQEEMVTKFSLHFDILHKDMRNPFEDHDFLIVRLDQMSRNDDLKSMFDNTEQPWDLIVCDEAHKMSAYFYGRKTEKTKRYLLAEQFAQHTRHFLLMTATPHSGNNDNFQLFMSLLDKDRFYGKNETRSDTSDMMRRMVKESLYTFEGEPLFPKRYAETVDYPLSEREQELYDAVTDYVREEFNRADKLKNDGRKNTIGFALTVLQRRLASSPLAIYSSLKNRRKRLEIRLQDAEKQRRDKLELDFPLLTDEDVDDYEDKPADELDKAVESLVDKATASSTLSELRAEIESLKSLEKMAEQLYRSGEDRKWIEFRDLFESDKIGLSRDSAKHAKVVIFTEHLQTLGYLYQRITDYFGTHDGIVTIHGSMKREDRLQVQEDFRHNPDVFILIATDAAGEGINLQSANLMINYDLPWNPNRLEQRFGRIHRIGQKKPCYLWNLVSGKTREGLVYQRLLKKLEVERHALNGQVFDILGKVFEDEPLRKLLERAIREGDKPATLRDVERQIDAMFSKERIQKLLEDYALVPTALDKIKIVEIRQARQRAEARRLQPYFIRDFFLEAFGREGGLFHQRETNFFEITQVPPHLRSLAKTKRLGALPNKYNRICFDKDLIRQYPEREAEFVCVGHPLLETLIASFLDKKLADLARGGVLIDDNDPSEEPRILVYLEHTLQDGNGRAASKEVHFVEIYPSGDVRGAGYAPYIDYRPATDGEKSRVTQLRDELLTHPWLAEHTLKDKAISYAIAHFSREHHERVKHQRKAQTDKTSDAVYARLNKAISELDRESGAEYSRSRSSKLSQHDQDKARAKSRDFDKQIKELETRRAQRIADLEREGDISSLPPVVIGCALILPIGMISEPASLQELRNRKQIELLAMQAVMDAELALGNQPTDVSRYNVGYDIESIDAQGELRFIEVKGRDADADSITLTRNEIMTALNQPNKFILAIALIRGEVEALRYVRHIITKEPENHQVSANYDLQYLLDHSTEADE